MNLRALPILLTFLLMGIADAMGPLSSQVSRNPVLAALMPFFVFIAFALFSVPAGLLAARRGRKNLLLLGLGLCAAATAVPTFMDPSFPLLLAAIFLLGIGTTFLQVAGNPILRDVSPAGDYSRNLALAQAVKGIGSTASAYLVTAAVSLAFLAGLGWRGAFPLFFVLMVLALVAVAFLKAGEGRAEVPPSAASCLALLREPVFALAVLGIFLYVGAEVCMGTFLQPSMARLFSSSRAAALFGPSLFFFMLMLGRLAAGLVRLRPALVLRASAALGLAGTLLVMTGQRVPAAAGVVVAGLGFANIWPMLFSITVEHRPERASELSGLMCMAISGGAVIPLVMGRLGGGARALAFLVPAACFAYLLLLALAGGKPREA